MEPISSHVYAKGRPTYPAELYLWLSQQVDRQASVWDCACGTGQVSLDLTAYFDHVEANDINELQVAEATPHKKITYQVSASESISYPDQHFDAICVGQAMHYFDFDAFWPEVKRTLKPNGIFACWGYSGLSVSAEIDDIINNSVLSILSPHWPAQNKTIWNHYSQIDFPLQMIDPPKFELTFNWSAHRVFDYIKTWSAWRGLAEDEGSKLLDEAWQKVTQIWTDPNEKRMISIPFFVKVGRLKI